MNQNWTIFIMKFVKKTDNINRILITLTGFFYWYLNRSDLGLERSDYINRMITLTVITLSGFYCITFEPQKLERCKLVQK
jgi:hypothetical protein